MSTLTRAVVLLGILLFTCACMGVGAWTDAGIKISGIQVLDVTPTTVTIEWHVSPEATGQVEFGETTEYGRLSTLETGRLPFHRQLLRGLIPDTRYHARIRATIPAGSGLSGDFSFRTGRGVGQAPSMTGVYGSGIAIDSKNNQPLDGTLLAHRFRAGTTSPLLGVRFQQRGGPVYSGGDGGTIRVSIQSDDGTARHRPSGDVLAEVTVAPGNPDGDWTTFERYGFPEPPTLSEGSLYHIVFENTAATPAVNYISVNEVFVFRNGARPRQPALEDDYAVLSRRKGAWRLSGNDTADMDLDYADGTHDGLGYVENMCDLYGVISGPSAMVRESFRVSGGPRVVSSAWVRVGRTAGDSPLTIRLEDGGGGLIEAVDVPAEQVPLTVPGCSEDNAVWVSISFAAPRELQEGAEYRLVLTAAADTEFTTDPIREGTDSGFFSYRFTDGGAERTTDGGATWQEMYPWSPVDLQFYFR